MSRLGRINDEILSVYNTYNTPELHDKILEFLQKDLILKQLTLSP